MKFLGLTLLLLYACGVPRNEQEAPRDGFQYDMDGEVVAIVFDSTAGPQSVDVQIQVNQNQFDITVSADAVLQERDAQAAALSSAERKALAQAALDYAQQQGVNEHSPLLKRSVYLAFDYLAQAPDNRSR